MGNRAEIVVSGPEYKPNGDPWPVPHEIYIYTHWRGDELPILAAIALDRADDGRRLSDLPYLSRIFLDVVSSHASDETAGAGVANYANAGAYKAVYYRKRRNGDGHTTHVELSGYEYLYPELEGRQMPVNQYIDAIADASPTGGLDV